nr:NADH dehydrogenase [ubiquinone] 1 alpha subcomplex subunit 6-like [Ciona intestinalis]|eukprot:XP_002125596.1 NADH dehydrogenase [ubiquinone] 1 alpha subcomplex subunit 6-like [Ciona intestinalis]
MSSVVARALNSSKRIKIKPIVSSNPDQAKRRVLTLYKQWFRAVPLIIRTYQLPYPVETVQAKIKENFMKNSHVRDVRAIDILIIKGEMDLQETLLNWKQDCHVRDYFEHPTKIQEPTDFLGKFLTQKH